MANAAGLINAGLWQDPDFRGVPRLPQCTFVQLLSTKDLDCAGVITINLRVLAKACHQLTEDQLVGDLQVLEAHRFAFADFDTDELLIRSYMRRVSVRSPNAWKSGLKAARMLSSRKLRRVLAMELRRIPRRDAAALADELDPDPNPSETHPEPIRNPSAGDNPSGTHPEPPSSVLDQYLTLVSGQVGSERPSDRCRKHRTTEDPPPCRSCGAARTAAEAYDARIRQSQTDTRRAFIEACDLCDDNGMAETAGGLMRCHHGRLSIHA